MAPHATKQLPQAIRAALVRDYVAREEKRRAALRTPVVVVRCDGEQDEHGRPCCDGDDIQAVRVGVPTLAGREWSDAHYCAECRRRAEHQGMELVLASDEMCPVETHDAPDMMKCTVCGTLQPERERCDVCGVHRA